MRARRKQPRKRCTECRRWYRPSRTATGSQKTCSRACRKKRQCKLAKRRRLNELDEYRSDERLRQASHRERQRAERVNEAQNRSSSRATLSALEAILRGQIVASWDRQMALSRTRFERQIGHLLGRAGANLRQAGTENADGHALP